MSLRMNSGSIMALGLAAIVLESSGTFRSSITIHQYFPQPTFQGSPSPKPEHIEDFRTEYSRGLLKCADTDGNHIVTQAETDAFDAKVLAGKDATLIVRTPERSLLLYNSTGKDVPLNVIAQWIHEYTKTCSAHSIPPKL